MNKKNIFPNPQQPVDRVPTRQLPNSLAELSEEAIGSLALPAGPGERRPAIKDGGRDVELFGERMWGRGMNPDVATGDLRFGGWSPSYDGDDE